MVVLGLAVLVAAFVAAFILRARYADQERERNALASRRQDYALCVVQNANRKATRQAALIQYATIADVIDSGGPADPKLRRQFEKHLAEIKALLKAQQPIDCTTYVSPDLPPDLGVVG
jgi:hypothetical protein